MEHERYRQMGEQSKLSLRKALASLATRYADMLLFEDTPGGSRAITKRSIMRSMIIFIFERVLFMNPFDETYTYKVKVGGDTKSVDLNTEDGTHKDHSDILIRMSDFTMRMYGADVSLRDLVHSVVPMGYDGGDDIDWEWMINIVENMIGRAYVWLKGDMEDLPKPKQS